MVDGRASDGQRRRRGGEMGVGGEGRLRGGGLGSSEPPFSCRARGLVSHAETNSFVARANPELPTSSQPRPPRLFSRPLLPLMPPSIFLALPWRSRTRPELLYERLRGRSDGAEAKRWRKATALSALARLWYKRTDHLLLELHVPPMQLFTQAS